MHPVTLGHRDALLKAWAADRCPAALMAYRLVTKVRVIRARLAILNLGAP